MTHVWDLLWGPLRWPLLSGCCLALSTQLQISPLLPLVQVQLHDALSVAGAVGVATDGPAPAAPSSKRLACHVAVLRGILASGALGPLQRVMETITAELLRAAYRCARGMELTCCGSNKSAMIKMSSGHSKGQKLGGPLIASILLEL